MSLSLCLAPAAERTLADLANTRCLLNETFIQALQLTPTIAHSNSHRLIVLIPLVTALLFLLALCSHRTRPRRLYQFNSELLHFITPTSSLWPLQYCFSSQEPTSRLHLNLGALLADLARGIIELRRTSGVRYLLTATNAEIGNTTVLFRVEAYMWTSAACFIIKNELFLQPPVGALRINPRFDILDSSNATEARRCFRCLNTTSGLTVLLDRVPRQHIDQAMRDLISNTPISSHAVIHFSVKTASRPSIFSRQMVLLCMVLAFTHSPYHPEPTSNASPLFLTLSSVLDSLTGPGRVVIDEVRNISQEYADDLVSWPLAVGSDWRRIKLFRQLQAEVYRIGWLDRFRVVVRRVK